VRTRSRGTILRDRSRLRLYSFESERGAMTKRTVFPVPESKQALGSKAFEWRPARAPRSRSGRSAQSRILALISSGIAMGALAGFAFAEGAGYLATALSPVARSSQPQTLSIPNLPSTRAKVATLEQSDSLSTTDTNLAPRAAFEATNLARTLPSPAPERALSAAALPVVGVAPAGPDARSAHEAALIEEAQSSLAAGNAAQALVILDEYAALDRTERLDGDANLLRRQALAALVTGGKQAAAIELARNYLGPYPGDPPKPAPIRK